MGDALTNENGSHLRALASLLPRLQPFFPPASKLGPAFGDIRERFSKVNASYALAFAGAAENCRTRQVGVADVEKVFLISVGTFFSAARTEDDLLQLLTDLVKLLGARAKTASMTPPDARQLRELDRAVQNLHGLVYQSAYGESRGARGAMHVDDDDDRCEDCGVELRVNGERSEKDCPQCARVFAVYGVVFDDAQLHQQEGQRGKSGCFSPSQHYEDWIRNILALESDEVLIRKGSDESPADVIDALRAAALRKNKMLSRLTIEDVRGLLKTVGRTDLNPHTSLILKKLTGVGPPDISKERRFEGGAMFARVLDARDGGGGGNRRYYPYYMVKIFDLILPPGDPDRQIFKFIHLQSPITLRRNDKEWESICAETGWKYRPTDPATLY